MEKVKRIISFFDGFNELFKTHTGNENEEIVLNEINEFLSINIEDIIYAIQIREEVLLDSSSIPIFSNFKYCTDNICYALDALDNDGASMIQMGKYLRQTEIGKDMAFYKYGETHSKASTLLGLTTIRSLGDKKVFLSNIGYFYLRNKELQNKLLTRLLLHTKIIQNIIKNCSFEEYEITQSMSFLSDKTINRRLSNVKKFVFKLEESNEYNFSEIIKNVNFAYKEIGD